MLSTPAALLPAVALPSPWPDWLAQLFRRELRHDVTGAGAHRPALRFNQADYTLVEYPVPERRLIEQFIRQRFAASFGARVDSFMPRLFGVHDARGELCGAFGLRSATRKLFLEQYLDVPIEAAIAAHRGGAVERQVVVEVGHFCGTFPGAVRAMIGLLTERLHREGCAWVAFTGTSSLRNAFHRMGLAPIDIQAADVARLAPEERPAWGSYYDHAPRVLVGDIGEGHRALLRAKVSAGERA